MDFKKTIKFFTMTNDYLESMIRLLEKYKGLAEKTFEQVSDDQLHWQFNEESNSIAILINHLWGNMMSRWTDFLTSDGEKEWRKRDAEFETNQLTRQELMARWNEGWACMFRSIKGLSGDDLSKTITIRGKQSTVTDAINMATVHYVSHIGQIMYIGKMVCGDKWVTLSQPKKKA